MHVSRTTTLAAATAVFAVLALAGAQQHPARFTITLDVAAYNSARSTGEYAPASLKQLGFIHCSTANETTWVLQHHFEANATVEMAVVQASAVPASSPIKWVVSVPELPPFPHVFGPIPLTAFVNVVNVTRPSVSTPWTRDNVCQQLYFAGADCQLG